MLKWYAYFQIQLKVEIKTQFISVKKKTGEMIIEGELYDRINAGESVWKIERNSGKTFLTFNL